MLYHKSREQKKSQSNRYKTPVLTPAAEESQDAINFRTQHDGGFDSRKSSKLVPIEDFINFIQEESKNTFVSIC